MNGLSVVIPSRNGKNLEQCLRAIREHNRGVRIIVVDDGLVFSPTLGAETLLHERLKVNQGVKPFIFARNCNIGITSAGDDDVILLNDDALLESAAGFSALQWALEVRPECGLISATTNLAGNPAQYRQQQLSLRLCPVTPGNSFPVVAFVCVLIPRKTIDAVGLLDERFTAYGWEDNDYCRRVHMAGLKIGIYDGCFVNHAKLHSTFRGDAYAAGDINAGRKIYLDKWGSM